MSHAVKARTVRAGDLADALGITLEELLVEWRDLTHAYRYDLLCDTATERGLQQPVWWVGAK